MQLICPINPTEDADLKASAEALAELLGDEANPSAIQQFLEAGQIIVPADRVLDAQQCLAEKGILVTGPVQITVVLPSTDIEEAMPRSYRVSTAIARLLGEEEGDIPSQTVYDLIDVIGSWDSENNAELNDLMGEVLCRAVIGVTGHLPEAIQQGAGLIEFRNARERRMSELIDAAQEAQVASDEA